MVIFMRIIIKGIFLIVLGFVIGHFIFGTKIDIINKLSKKDSFYFLQQGIYTNSYSLKNNTKHLTNKIIDKSNNKYYVYVAITKDKDIADKIIKIYKNKGISLIKKEKYLKSKEFSNSVDQFDILVKDTNEEDEIITIEEVILENYKEIVKKE